MSMEEFVDDVLARADALDDAGDAKGAVGLLTEAMMVAPDEPRLYAVRGYIYRAHKGWRKAIADFDRALILHPDAPTTLFCRGACKSTIADFDGALDDFRRSIELKTAADAWWEMGFIHKHRGELQAAISSYEKAYELEPENYPGLPDEIAELQAKLSKSE